MNTHHALVTDFLNAMVARDRETLARVVSEDAIWHVPPSVMPQFAGPHLGRNAILALVGGAGDLFVLGSQRAEIEYIVAEGNVAAAMFRQIAETHSHRIYDNLYSFFFRLKDGYITEIWENLDTGYFYGLFEIDPSWVRDGMK